MNNLPPPYLPSKSTSLKKKAFDPNPRGKGDFWRKNAPISNNFDVYFLKKNSV